MKLIVITDFEPKTYRSIIQTNQTCISIYIQVLFCIEHKTPWKHSQGKILIVEMCQNELNEIKKECLAVGRKSEGGKI